MAAKWQQWMPFHIDRFRGSPAVQAMHPCARAGYLYLLASAWQTEDCTLSNDPIGLAELSGLGDELWALHGPRILRNFTVLENGKLQNPVVLVEWNDARERFGNKYVSPEELHEIRSAAGRRGNELRWKDRKISQNASGSDAKSSQTHRKTSHTVTGTYTETNTKTLAQSVPPEELAGTLPLINGTDYQVSKSQLAEWVEAFPAVNVKQQLAEMKAWLNANPTRRKTPKGMCRSIVLWLGKEQDKGGHLIPMTMPVAPKPKTQYEIDRDEQQAERREALRLAGAQ